MRMGEIIPREQARRVVRTVAEVLRYAHGEGVFHGDVRPSHVTVTPRQPGSQGDVKLGETGVAKGVRGSVQRMLQGLGWTFADAVTGKKAGEAMEKLLRELDVVTFYLAPELAAPRAAPDARSDVYGLGATYYHMVTGVPPFAGSSPARMLLGQSGTARPPHEADPEVPEPLSRLIQKMMSPAPETRHQSMEEVIADLEGVKGL